MFYFISVFTREAQFWGSSGVLYVQLYEEASTVFSLPLWSKYFNNDVSIRIIQKCEITRVHRCPIPSHMTVFYESLSQRYRCKLSAYLLHVLI